MLCGQGPILGVEGKGRNGRPLGRDLAMNTRTIAIAALVIAVIVLLLIVL